MRKRLKEARQEANLTQEEAATLARIARHSIQRYETGRREPTASNLKTLADVYSKNLDWFWGDQEEKSAPKARQLPTKNAGGAGATRPR